MTASALAKSISCRADDPFMSAWSGLLIQYAPPQSPAAPTLGRALEWLASLGWLEIVAVIIVLGSIFLWIFSLWPERSTPPKGQATSPRVPLRVTEALRLSAAAGDFYPGDPVKLRGEVQSYVATGAEKVAALGCLVPHDSYAFSGHVMGAVYGRLKLARRFVILSPNHTGTGQRLAMLSQGAWPTPLGLARIDRELARELGGWFRLLREDPEALRSEQGVEAQLPFLQVLQPDFTFVPVSVSVGQFEPLAELGEALASVLGKRMHEVLIVASSNMNHYEAESTTRWKDEKLLEPLLALDARGLFDGVHKYDVSMCGYAAAVVMLTAAKWLGARSAELVKYGTTGDITGSHHTVVGYAGVIVR